MTLILFIIGFVLGAGAIVFALQNTDIVALTFLSWEFESSVALLVIASVAVGVAIGLLATLPSAISSSFRIMGLKKENKKLAHVIETQPETIAVVVPERDVV